MLHTNKITTISRRSVSTTLVLAIAVFFIASFSSPALANVGISPGKIVATNILRNSTQTKTVNVQRDGNSVQDATTFVVTSRGEYAQYISAPAEFTMAAGQRSVDYIFDITPQNAATGDYEVFLDITPKTVTNQESQNSETVAITVNVVSGATVTVDFTVVGTETIAYEVMDLQVQDTEVGQPLLASINVNNTGNVEWKPSKIELTLTDTADTMKVITTTIESADILVTKPGAIQTIDLVAHPTLTEGRYQVRAKVYDTTKQIADLTGGNVTTVYAPGTMKQLGELGTLTTNKTQYSPNEKIKLESTFKNTGTIALRGVLITEISKDTTVIDLVRSQEFTVDKGEKVTFPQMIQLADVGNYTLASHVEYGYKTTVTKTVNISVRGDSWLASPLGAGIALGVVIVLTLASAILYKRFRQFSIVVTTSKSKKN